MVKNFIRYTLRFILLLLVSLNAVKLRNDCSPSAPEFDQCLVGDDSTYGQIFFVSNYTKWRIVNSDTMSALNFSGLDAVSLPHSKILELVEGGDVDMYNSNSPYPYLFKSISQRRQEINAKKKMIFDKIISYLNIYKNRDLQYISFLSHRFNISTWLKFSSIMKKWSHGEWTYHNLSVADKV